LPYLLNNVTAKDKLGLDMQNALGKWEIYENY
jgi:hypothetical protein